MKITKAKAWLTTAVIVEGELGHFSGEELTFMFSVTRKGSIYEFNSQETEETSWKIGI